MNYEEVKKQEEKVRSMALEGSEVVQEIGKYLEMVVSEIEKRNIEDKDLSSYIDVEREIYEIVSSVLEEIKTKESNMDTLVTLFKITDKISRLK